MNRCEKGKAEINGCLYFTISKLYRIMSRIAEDSFAKLDMCSTHGYLLVLLQEDEEGLTVGKISETLAIAPSTVTRFLDKLEVRGYVERIKTGKQSIAKITAEGKKVMSQVYTCWNEVFKKIEYLVNDDKYLSEVFETFSKFTDMIEKSQENIKLFQSQENSTEE